MPNNGMKQDYQVLLDMIEEVKEQEKTYVNLVKEEFKSVGVSYDGLSTKLINISDNDIKDESFVKLVKDHYIIDEEMFKQSIDEIIYDANCSTEEAIIELILKLKERIDNLSDIRKESAKLQMDANSVVNEYVNYLTSPEYQQKKKDRIANIKSLIETEKDPVKKSKMKKMINDAEASMTLSFIFDRFEKDPVKEKNNIIDGYFDNKHSSYVIKKYKTKARMLGYNPDLYKYFFNLEEKFLEEEYHVYNNLFLYYVMRFVGYCDTYNNSQKMFAHALISSIANLIYYKFPTDDDKENFLNIMRRFLDYFKDDYDKFDKDNILHPNHPYRKEKDLQRDKEVRNMVFTNMRNNGIEITKEIEDMPTEELKEYYIDLLEEIEKSKDNNDNETSDKDIITINESNEVESNSTEEDLNNDLEKSEEISEN